MTDAAAQAGAPPASSAASASPWLIAILVALAAFMEVLDTTIANVVLPYIAGGMGVSDDEASWVVTTYLVANAVSLTASPFLAKRLGRKTFFLICLGLFSVSSLLCAQAWNLDSLLLFRLLQGLAGGGMVPVSQSILAASFPPEKRGQAFALFGVAVVVAPVVGPTLGGWLADNWSWRWCFLINGPVGVATIALIAILLPADNPNQAQSSRFDYIGFLLVATFLGALEIVLDRGLEDDWFGSNFIVTFTFVCAHRVRADDPLGDVQARSHDRRKDGGVAPVRRLLPGDGRDRRDPLRDHPVPAAHVADGLRLYRDLGRSRRSRRAASSPW